MFQEFISQVQVLIVGVPDLEYEPFASQGEAAGLSSDYGSLYRGGINGEIGSWPPTCFNVAFFSFAQCGVAH